MAAHGSHVVHFFCFKQKTTHLHNIQQCAQWAKPRKRNEKSQTIIENWVATQFCKRLSELNFPL